MAVSEVLVDQKSTNILPPDPNVIIPKHVRDAAAQADAIHASAYEAPQPEPQPEPQPQPQPQPAPAPEPQPSPAPAPEPQPEPQPQPSPPLAPDNFTGPASDQDMRDSQWAGRYNSMHGRYQSAQRQIGAMQDQLQQLAGELERANEIIARSGTAPAPQSRQVGHDHGNLITEQDRENYGDELIDVARRAAREQLEPAIQALRAENNDLKKRVTTTAQREVKQKLQDRIPNWVTIQRSPEFQRWLSLPNVYTSQVRGQMLNAAYGAADAPKVIAIFQDFINEVKATGGELPGARQEQQPPPAVPPQPAIQLETLAAPGRARPAGGNTALPADKPTYTRAQISANYANRRKGLYAGREAEWQSLETDMIAAGNEGRVR